MMNFIKKHAASATGSLVGLAVFGAAFLNPFYLAALSGFSVSGFTPFAFLSGFSAVLASLNVAAIAGLLTAGLVSLGERLVGAFKSAPAATVVKTEPEAVQTAQTSTASALETLNANAPATVAAVEKEVVAKQEVVAQAQAQEQHDHTHEEHHVPAPAM